jgi:hypothetical protein
VDDDDENWNDSVDNVDGYEYMIPKTSKYI